MERIGIIGAGIGGLALAALLAKRGAQVAVFDAFDAPRPVGSGLVLQPVGQAALAELGALEAAAAQGQWITRLSGHEAESKRIVLSVAYDPVRGQRRGLAIHRAALFQTLFDAAERAGATFHQGHRADGATADHITFDGARRAGPFDLVVDASGANSVLSPLRGRALPYGAIWGTVPWPDGAPLPTDALSQCYRRADRMIGVLPVGTVPGLTGRQATLFWSLRRDGYDAWRAKPLDAWKAEVTTLWPAAAPYLAAITDHDQMTMARYRHGSLTNPYRDGIAFIGDAWHRASPQLGQGANMALLDAVALTRALAHHRDRDLALWAYGRARRAHVAAYQTLSWAFTPQYQSDSRLLPRLRDHVLAPLSRTWPTPRILARLVAGDLVPPLGSLSGRSGAL